MAGRADYTGREAERLREEHAAELRARQGQIGLVNEAPPTEEPDVVYGMDGKPVAAGAAGKRNALPHARIMIHQPLAGMEGTATELEIHYKEVMRIKQMMNEVLLRHTGQTLSKIEQDTDRDNFMSPEEAKSYGLIDNILERLPANIIPPASSP